MQATREAVFILGWFCGTLWALFCPSRAHYMITHSHDISHLEGLPLVTNHRPQRGTLQQKQYCTGILMRSLQGWWRSNQVWALGMDSHHKGPVMWSLDGSLLLANMVEQTVKLLVIWSPRPLGQYQNIGCYGEREIKCIGLFGERGHRGPYSPYKPCNHNLYIGGNLAFRHTVGQWYEASMISLSTTQNSEQTHQMLRKLYRIKFIGYHPTEFIGIFLGQRWKSMYIETNLIQWMNNEMTSYVYLAPYNEKKSMETATNNVTIK